ncbi:MAG: PIN domain-containing protein [Treponema sp.]|nr:PIN domain-containing protein [Treponema sp.]
MHKVYLLDTNIISEVYRASGFKVVKSKVIAYSEISAIASMTYKELSYGIERLPDSKKKQDLKKFMDVFVEPTFPVIEYDKQAASIHAHIQTELEEKGMVRDPVDLIIASIAIANNMILVTRNQKHFEGIPLLNTENWFE